MVKRALVLDHVNEQMLFIDDRDEFFIDIFYTLLLIQRILLKDEFPHWERFISSQMKSDIRVCVHNPNLSSKHDLNHLDGLRCNLR